MLTLASAAKRRIKLRLPLPPLGSPSTTPCRGCHGSCGPREAVVSHEELLLRLQSGPVLAEVRRLHAALLVRGYSRSTVLAAQLVRAYARLGDAGLGHALCVFDGMPKRNSFAWNAVIKGLVDAGRFSEALGRYWDMASDGSVAADRFTYPPVLKSCAALGAVEQGRRVRENIEAEITRGDAVPNVFVQCALVDMFAKCRCLDEARSVFESMGVRDLAAWTAMIGGAVHGGDWFEVMDLFGRMRSEGVLPDSLIFATVIPACGRAKELRTGMTLQGCAVRCGVDDDICVRNALIDMYCKCDCLDVAASLFLSIRYKDVVSWSTIIVGHSQNGMYGSSVSLFTEMVSSGVKPNSTTLATILPSLLELKLSSHGKAIHCFSIRNGLDHSEFLVSAFIDFYSKQGLVGEAEIVFEFSPKKDLVIWNSMVGGYAVNEDSESALHALRALQKVGLRPDHVTIVSVLPLCNQHPRLLQGLIDKGLRFYNSMLQDYNISAGKEHHSCIVDLYSRSGKLDDAWSFIVNLQEVPEIDVLGCLLSACREHNRMDLVELVAEIIFQQNPSDPGYHILLSNIYANAGMWSHVTRIRTMVENRSLKKITGNSSI
ncbi:hypothetical protein HU200_045937 [Digitaria exilis]|uniref:Pentatricopeptide repeat-containing protein n=1 Tax=Digitaria exilis TaxID=1010633 RepID=A0A835EBK2_9POAL|nr:hypothetical protein HU200_045937 [Digitaria exilis]